MVPSLPPPPPLKPTMIAPNNTVLVIVYGIIQNVHVIHFKKSIPLSAKQKVLHPQLKKKHKKNSRVKTRPPPPPSRNQMGRP